ncbi:MAG: hypothetical protein SVT52_09000 [Planctomycetota bacterium]|nr:hypothetical protein [Planctomycetota bacterium]
MFSRVKFLAAAFASAALFIICVSPSGCEKKQQDGRRVPSEGRPSPNAATAPAAETDAIDTEHLAVARKLIDGGVRYLLAHGDADGGWSMGGGANKPAITAMVLKALVQQPGLGADSPVVRRGFELLLGFQQKDGGIYDPRVGLANYTTAVAVMAMAAAQNPQHNAAMRRATAFLKGRQIVPGAESPDGDAIGPEHPFVGGVSYGKHGRPDLSNVGMWMQALHDAGISGDDPAIQRALAFVARSQNRSESNPSAWAARGANDGGFVYAPATPGKLAAGQSKAGAATGGRGLRSYGSMTYVGFKSLLYAGLDHKDPRVLAAFEWIRTYWRLDSNPNMPRLQSQQGLYYYYHAFAKALRAWGEPIITDRDGVEHNWRHELIKALERRVRADGSWVNDAAPRWEESNPNLVTCYAVLALQETLKK